MSNDLPDVRASHKDRDRVVKALRVAGGDGRLTSNVLRIETDMVHGKLIIVGAPDIVVDTVTLRWTPRLAACPAANSCGRLPRPAIH